MDLKNYFSYINNFTTLLGAKTPKVGIFPYFRGKRTADLHRQASSRIVWNENTDNCIYVYT